MSVERIESMKNSLMSCVESQMADLKNVDAHELGEAVDMIKDLAEAAYYCTITEAMKNKEKENTEIRNNNTYYTERVITPTSPNTQKYYDDGWNERYYQPIMYMGPDTNGNIGNNRYYENMSRYYEDGNTYTNGISPQSRKMYIEAKNMHKGSTVQMQELENYMKDLSKDITDMIGDASPEEKLLLQQKLITLANKIKPNNAVTN